MTGVGPLCLPGSVTIASICTTTAALSRTATSDIGDNEPATTTLANAATHPILQYPACFTPERTDEDRAIAMS
jgi:hypothetical protein